MASAPGPRLVLASTQELGAAARPPPAPRQAPLIIAPMATAGQSAASSSSMSTMDQCSLLAVSPLELPLTSRLRRLLTTFRLRASTPQRRFPPRCRCLRVGSVCLACSPAAASGRPLRRNHPIIAIVKLKDRLEAVFPFVRLGVWPQNCCAVLHTPERTLEIFHHDLLARAGRALLELVNVRRIRV